LAEGVYLMLPVVAFDPAEDDPESAKLVEAPGPLVPAEAPLWI
jgi:hypothetical protein